MSFATIGNTLHAVNLFNICAYGGLLYLYGSEADGVFDAEWLREGFCLPHEETPFWTTRDWCGYVMVSLALLGLAVQRALSVHMPAGSEEMSSADRLTFWALVGAIGHASGHFILSRSKRNKYLPPGDMTFIDDLRHSTFVEVLYKAGPGYPLFWCPLVKTYTMNTTKDRVALVALIVNFCVLFIPSRFGFAFTQAVLFGGMSIDQLMLPKTEKGFEYALWPLLTTIPNGMFAWLECLTCTSNLLMKQHGHIVYDLYMVSSYIIFYLICWLREQAKTVKAKKNV